MPNLAATGYSTGHSSTKDGPFSMKVPTNSSRLTSNRNTMGLPMEPSIHSAMRWGACS